MSIVPICIHCTLCNHYNGSKDITDFNSVYNVQVNDPTQDITWAQMDAVIDQPVDLIPLTTNLIFTLTFSKCITNGTINK